MRIYMEIDGVVNARHSPDLWGSESFDSIDFAGYTFVWSTKVVSKIVDMCEKFDAEIVWVSSWSEQMPVLARLLGFGHIGAEARVLEDVGVGSTPFEKADAILRDLEISPSTRGWMWLDAVSDDVVQSNEYVGRMVMENGYVPPISDVVGLTPELAKYMEKKVLVGSVDRDSRGRFIIRPESETEGGE